MSFFKQDCDSIDIHDPRYRTWTEVEEYKSDSAIKQFKKKLKKRWKRAAFYKTFECPWENCICKQSECHHWVTPQNKNKFFGFNVSRTYSNSRGVESKRLQTSNWEEVSLNYAEPPFCKKVVERDRLDDLSNESYVDKDLCK